MVAVRNAKLVEPSHKPTGTIEQIELILVTAVDIEGLQTAQAIRIGVDCNDRVLPQPIGPAFLDDFACVERDRQTNAKKLCGVGIVAAAIAKILNTLKEPSGCFWADSSCCHQRSIELPAPASARRTAGMSGR